MVLLGAETLSADRHDPSEASHQPGTADDCALPDRFNVYGRGARRECDPHGIGILNTGSGSMTWNATAQTLSGSGWLSLPATSGTVTQPFFDGSFVNVSVNAQNLATGQYFGNVQVTAPGARNSPQTVVIVLNVLPA